MTKATNTTATETTKTKSGRKGVLSRGLRNSGGRVHRKHAAIIVQAERVATAMREAFLNIKLAGLHTEEQAKAQGNVVGHILTSAKRNAGNNTVGRGWTANLSPRTVRALTEQGVFA